MLLRICDSETSAYNSPKHPARRADKNPNTDLNPRRIRSSGMSREQAVHNEKQAKQQQNQGYDMQRGCEETSHSTVWAESLIHK